MLSIFPDLLPYGLLSATIVRVLIGAILIYFGELSLYKKRADLTNKLVSLKYPAAKLMIWPLGLIKIIVGVSLVLGFLTQVMVIIAAYIFINLAVIDEKEEKIEEKIFGQARMFYVVMIVISLSLLFSGAGFLAIDLPI